MILLVFLFLTIYQLVFADIHQRNVVVNCSWPCPNIFDTCVLTETNAQCQAKGINEWVINNPIKIPVYTGAYSSVENSPCILAPIPSFPVFLNTTSLSEGQSVIKWPIIGIYKALDEYLGNCKRGMFCSSTGEDHARPTCRKGNAPGSNCVSSNQCQRDYCASGVCYEKDRGDNGSQYSAHNSNNGEKRRKIKKTIKIVASIVTILSALCIVFLIVMMIRRRRRRAKVHHDQNNNDHFHETPNINHSSDILKKQDQMVELSEESTQNMKEITPSMQQNILQKELRKSHHSYPQHYAKPPTY